MHIPTRDDFHALRQQGNMVPVYRQLMGDMLTPVLAFNRLRGAAQAFLLESVTGGEKIGRYSFLGVDPAVIFKSSGDHVDIIDTSAGTTESHTTNAPIDLLKELLAVYQPVELLALPRFSGGAVGYFAYDVVRQVEHLPNAPTRGLGLPDIYLGIYQTMIIFDHVNKTCKIVAHADCRETDDFDAAYDAAVQRVDALVELLSAPGELPIEDVQPQPEEDPPVTSNFAREDYERAVEACKEYIRAGDIFQVVLSQRLETECDLDDPFELYRTIRVINPSPYMFYLHFPELSLVGSSPEVMVRVEDGKITSRPIAGTRRRGKDATEDHALAKELLADPKEIAEHTMLVDLGRNDVGRVSEFGTVNLTDQFVIENYSHVMHLVSNVEGTLKAEYDALDAFKACLPAGTLSGAPKVRAMEIIDEFEPDVRGTYGGAVGYIDFSGNLDTCITIRTVLLHGGKAYVQAGGGLVADSVPAHEYEETRSKARALLRAISMVRAAQRK